MNDVINKLKSCMMMKVFYLSNGISIEFEDDDDKEIAYNSFRLGGFTTINEKNGFCVLV